MLYHNNPQPYPPKPLHKLAIVVKGEQKAVLTGYDLDELKARAHRYASAMNWHRAVVTCG